MRLSQFLAVILAVGLHAAVNAVKIGVSKSTNPTTPSILTTTSSSSITSITPTTSATLTLTTLEPTLLASTEQNFGLSDGTEPTTTAAESISTSPSNEAPSIFFTEFPPRKIKSTTPSTSPKTTITPKTTTISTTSVTSSTTGSNSTDVSLEATNETATSIEAFRFTNLERNSYCSCNLLSLACDINCCCDPDCPSVVLQIFDCNAAPKHPELRMRLENFHYQHGLPSCKVNDGWLCVFRTNTRPTKVKVVAANWDSTQYNKWPNLILNTAASPMDLYKYGTPLQVLNTQTLELQSLDLPTSFRPPFCLLTAPVRHLNFQRTHCLLKNLEELQKRNWNFFHLIANMKILSKPMLGITKLEKTSDLLIDLQIQRCTNHKPTKCQDVPLNDVAANSSYIKDLQLKIMHNYTNILAVCVQYLEQPFTATEMNQNKSLWQTYEVQFIYANRTEIETKQMPALFVRENEFQATSGPLGYLKGAPIIMTKIIAKKDTHEATTYSRVFDYFYVNGTQLHKHYSLPLLMQRQGLCCNNQNERSEQVINYGINVVKQCKLRLNNEPLARSNRLQEVNYTAICLDLQQLAWQQLHKEFHFNGPEPQPELYISQLGKPQNNSNKWTPLHIRNYDYTPITAQYNTRTQSFTCHNVVLSVAYEFFVRTGTEQDVPHQNLVEHATLIVGARHDLEFSAHELLDVPLTMSVMFYEQINESTSGAMEVAGVLNIYLYYIDTTLVLVLKIIFTHTYLSVS